MNFNSKKGNDLSVCHPELPRRRKAPRRLEVGDSEGAVITDKESYYRLIYYEALDHIINCIKTSFEQPGYQVYSHLEALLLKNVNKEDYSEDIEFVSNFYCEDKC